MLGTTSGMGATAMFTAIDRECDADTDMIKVEAVLNRHHAELSSPPGRGSALVTNAPLPRSHKAFANASPATCKPRPRRPERLRRSK